jgi:nicotinate-nucleotide adenylyltransferase
MNHTASNLSLALYGGSFDPVHLAHLRVAYAALEEAEMQTVCFIPAARSPLKASTTVASDSDRVKMLRLGTASEPRFIVDTCEIERAGTSYSIDTILDFRERFPHAALHWILGADQMELLPKWHRIEEIVALLRFIVFRRPGYSVAAPEIKGLRTLEIDDPLMPHSSSELRRRFASGDRCDEWLPPAVEAFISSRGLYTR